MSAGRARPVVAIDGPAGVGKSTTARKLAAELGFVLVDTGALYRGVALAAQDAGIAWTEADALGKLASELDLTFVLSASGEPRLHIAGVDRADEIRTTDIAAGASKVATHPPVRDALLGLQRRLGAEGGVVLEGRDIGTVVFPDAEVKVFLTAAATERAKRRVLDLAERGQVASESDILQQIEARDAQDSGREVAPLRPAADAVHLDSTHKSMDAVIAEIAALARAAGA
ncbi:MAG: (d)CMP kinase [Sandaracinaceae bacterium]|nr:(d)CMP kinase [Sandaracinaceae bacterium]MBK8410212.1 (d)CMP kinase [Sandaracinaceae bacterium]MBK8590587.1 (d)CMP kinase [Sandaracinaceae bacterium]MBP7686066.1 (d)CMP kinase [Deltaproteobacteria bacterium]